MNKIKITKEYNNQKVSFWLNGEKIFPISISGNIAEFVNGEMVVI